MRKWFRHFHFHTKLFLGIAVIALIGLGLITTSFYLYMCTTISHNEQTAMIQTVSSISSNLNYLLHNMNVALTATTYDHDLREMVTSRNTTQDPLEARFLETAMKRKVIGVFFHLPPASLLAVYNPKLGYYAYTGNVLDSPSWVNAQMQLLARTDSFLRCDQDYIFDPPHQNPWRPDDDPVISIRRKFFPASQNLTVFEIQVPYSYMQDICSACTEEDPACEIMIFDADGACIYPYETGRSSERQDYMDRIFSFSQSMDTNTLSAEKIKSEPLLLAKAPISTTGWSMMIVKNHRDFYARTNWFSALTAIIFITIGFVILLVLYAFTRWMTTPIKELTAKIQAVKLDNLSVSMPQDDSNELIMLYKAFSDMLNQLHQSIDAVYEAKVRENEANFLALQSRINPHFIYNTLQAISIACENEDAVLPSRMCMDLADLLRDTTKTTDKRTTLMHEMDTAQKYLKLVAIPYEGMVQYTIDVPEEMGTIEVPHLIIQPLLENSVNHGFRNTLPPWIIHVRGTMEDGTWKIVISDNGCGFPPDKLAALKDQLKQYSLSSLSHNIAINTSFGGMGILNIFSRLLLQEHENLIFDIESDSSGTVITIGGKQKEEEKS